MNIALFRPSLPRSLLLVWLIFCLFCNLTGWANPVLAPVENFVVNRAIGGILANRIAVAEGAAANDAVWLAQAANNPVYKSTMAAVSSQLTAVNVASTVAGVALTVAGAPVWLTLAASLGVIAVGTALVLGTTQVTIQQDGVHVDTQGKSSPDAPYVANPAPPGTWGLTTPPSLASGAQVYRDPSCFSSEQICMQFPQLPSSTSFPFRWRSYPGNQDQLGKLWTVAYSLDEFSKYYLADRWPTFSADYSNIDPLGQCGQRKMGDACQVSSVNTWATAPYWVFSGTSARLEFDLQSSTTYSPDLLSRGHSNATHGSIDDVTIDDAFVPHVYKTLDEAVQNLPSDALAQPIPDDLLAQVTDAAWRKAAQQTGYAGLPYPASNPITRADVATWKAANPDAAAKLDDLLRPATNPQQYPDGVPISPTVQPATNPNPGTGSNPLPAGTANVNVVNNPRVDLGPDPGVSEPLLEDIPTGWTILGPLINLFPELRGMSYGGQAGECPTATFDVFGKSVTMDQHCSIFEQHRGVLQACMGAAWLLIGLLILLSA